MEMNLCNRISIELAVTNMIESHNQENVVSSPLSINILLNMLAIGFEKGSTGQIELMNALGFTTIDEINHVSSIIMALMNSEEEEEEKEDRDEEFRLKPLNKHKNKKTKNIKKTKKKVRLMTSNGGPSLAMVNGVWSDPAFPFKTEFIRVAEEFYQARIRTLDFADLGRVVKEVNSWAEKHTNGLIKDLISEASLSDNGEKKTGLILANALYFKGGWQNTFDESMTEPETFNLLDGTSVETPFMKSTAASYQFYQSFDDFKVLKLCYQRGVDKTKELSMYLFVPEVQNGLKSMLMKFQSDPALIHTKCESMVNCITWIPKFKILFDFRPSDILKNMGLDLSEMGDLTNIVVRPKEEEGGVSKVIQKSYIEVTEKGTEAAAVSELDDWEFADEDDSPPPPPPVRFVADRPFFFMIKDDVSGVVLFSGIVRNPLLD